MSDNLKQTIHVLKLISEVRRVKTRNALLKDFSQNPQLRKALKEIARNVVNRNIPLNATDKKRLVRFKKVIFDLSSVKSKKKEKDLICQSGGFLPILIPIVTSLLASILNGK